MLILLSATLQAQDLYRMPEDRQSRMSSFENLNGAKGAGGQTNKRAKGSAAESVRAGETKVLLDVQEGGIIQRMWITIDDRSAAMLRSLRLRMYWDGETKPAVDVPLGDFFCVGVGKPVPFQSAVFSNPEGRSFNCYIPMPFRKGARITLTNEGKTNLALLFFDIDFVSSRELPADMLYFHACWNRRRTAELGQDMELLPKVKGRGRLLGVSVGVKPDSVYGASWWGEGEVKMYMDGDGAYPTVNGTGAEDYIGTGWGEGKFYQQYQGCLVADSRDGGYSFYRFHIPDEVVFYQDIKVTIQELGGYFGPVVRDMVKRGVRLQPVTIAGPGHFIRLLDLADTARTAAMAAATGQDWVNFYRIDDYAATAYFYLDRPVSELPALAGVAERVY